MKRILASLMILFSSLVLFGCETGYLSDSDIDNLTSDIEEYSDFNELTDKLHDEKLEDVELSKLYLREDFFNYNRKRPLNVELEYSTHYNAFSTLDVITGLINTVSEFNYDTYYQIEEYNSMLNVHRVDNVIELDYYQYFEELNVVSRQMFVLKSKEEKLYMERFSTTYDLTTETVLLNQKLSVLEDSHIETIEYIPKTMTMTYIYNSYEEQTYLKYKAFFDDFGEYTRETVELYLDSESSFVSYDIKEGELEDYRVKVFKDGHRVLKYDVNIFNKKDTETELTWNLLSVDGWVQVLNNGGEYKVYHSTGISLDDYVIDIQRNGYGKVIAYKMITGEVTEDDVSLESDNLESHITLEQLEEARLAFVDVYVEELASYGFILSNTVNRDIIELYFKAYLDKGKMNTFINEYK